MAGPESFEQLQAQIRSLRPAPLRACGEQVRDFDIEAADAGTRLGNSADSVGAQRGAPYAAYDERLRPTARWVMLAEPPALEAMNRLRDAATRAEQAQMMLALVETNLSRTDPPARAAAAAAAAVPLTEAIGRVTAAYDAIAPPLPPAAPVVVGSAGVAPVGGNGSGSGVSAGGAAVV